MGRGFDLLLGEYLMPVPTETAGRLGDDPD